MLVTITVVLAALAVLAAIVVVATGGGGELSAEHPDHPPLALPGRRSAGGTDAVLLRLPMGLWGYHKQITDEALERFAHELTERDTRIAVLEQELAEARQRLQEPPEQASRRPAVPPASPAPDSMDLRDPFESADPPRTVQDHPVDPSRTNQERSVDPSRTVQDQPVDPSRTMEEWPAEPPRTMQDRPAAVQERPADPPRTVQERPAPPQTIVDKVVFDPRAGRDAEEGPASAQDDADETRRLDEAHGRGENDRRGEDA